jgi:hypothetical protein
MSGQFIVTDKLGKPTHFFDLSNFDTVVCDYSANVKNLFNFDIKVAKRVEITAKTMVRILTELQSSQTRERRFSLDRIRNVG